MGFTRLIAASLLCILSAVVLGACDGGSRQANELSPDESALGDASALPPAARALVPVLQQEFARLGLDPVKTISKAPSGSKNAVFDLNASITDPDNAGPLPPVNIVLTWTERCIGDYDQNGAVSMSDLTPLAIYWCSTVLYDPPTLHFGLGYWPQGEPGGLGAWNWRLARIDGDASGVLSMGDLTPLAIHWGERVLGYDIFRKSPGSNVWELIPNPGGSDLPCTIMHHEADGDSTHPIRYAFTEAPTLFGQYSYFVMASDGNNDLKGPESNRIGVFFTPAGGVGQSPAARLSGNPPSGIAPVKVTWDASSTFDDGTIVKYEWDTDGDPNTWEADTGAVPTFQVNYDFSGTKTQWVRVTDNDGFVDTTSATVEVAGA